MRSTVPSLLGWSLLAALISSALQACGPLAIGAAVSGGGGSSGRTPTTVNFSETEPNETGPAANVVGSIFPTRTYIITGAHPNGADFDFFRIDATEPVRVQMTLTPNGAADVALLVGALVDIGGDGVPEMFVVDMMPGQGFAAGSTLISAGMATYTLRLQGQGIPSAPEGGSSPPLPDEIITYVHIDETGRVVSRTDVRKTDTEKP